MPWPVEMPCNFTFDSFRHKTVTESGGGFIVCFQTCRVGLKTSLLFLHIKICMYLLTNFSFFITCRDIYHLSLNVTKLLFFSVCI